MSRVLAFLNSSVWAMRSNEFDQMQAVAYRHIDRLDSFLALSEDPPKPEAMLKEKGERLNGTRYVEMHGDVAVIDINGAIAKRMGLFQEICFGGVSTEVLMKDFNKAAQNPGIKAIILNIDSPGGEAFGINEFAQSVFDTRKKMPVKAYISGLGCSGAYWIASAADEIVTDKSAFLGSIGVVTAWSDDKEFYKQMGIRREVVTSSNAKFKRLDFDNEEHRAELQKELDSIEKVFHKSVARNRKVKIEQVIKDFNYGGVLSGEDAVKAKMADRTGSLDALIKEVNRKVNQTSSNKKMNKNGDTMSIKNKILSIFDDEETIEAEASKKTAPGFAEGGIVKPPESAKTDETALELKAERERAEKAEQKLAEAEAKEIASFADAAQSFYETELSAGRIVPAEKDLFIESYIQAATDDRNAPLDAGSRVDRIKATQAKRAPHSFFDEKVSADANEKFLVLAAGSGKGDAKTELLEQTPLGKQTLKVLEGGKQ